MKMLKVVILLDCNECGRSLCKAAVCSTPEQVAWQKEIGRLVHEADQDGWRFLRDYGICPECIESELTMSDWLQDTHEEDLRA
jgi:hypothetical protein